MSEATRSAVEPAGPAELAPVRLALAPVEMKQQPPPGQLHRIAFGSFLLKKSNFSFYAKANQSIDSFAIQQYYYSGTARSGVIFAQAQLV
jgi:hypothetical protein